MYVPLRYIRRQPSTVCKYVNHMNKTGATLPHRAVLTKLKLNCPQELNSFKGSRYILRNRELGVREHVAISVN